ncbi:hypothetical protein RN001_000481 [Aquatica leii]|uniref:Uncharacterized protein n=1 Tax=Aquatica leii TaxID=1421715 RepID=A0AAN7Q9P0_9COLE|nr:hypothetical protein RN001_000481 [Aquatica leii]
MLNNENNIETLIVERDFTVDLNDLCEKHAIRCIRLIYEKIVDVCTLLNTTWNYVQSANLFWAFAEFLYQCLSWYEKLYKKITFNWTWTTLSFLSIFTSVFTTFIFVQGCNATKLEVHKIKKELHAFYMKSEKKLIIKEDIKSFMLLILHRPSPFFDTGKLTETTNTLVGELNALVTILVFGIQYNLPKSEGVVKTIKE